MRTLHRKPQPQHRPEHTPFIVGLCGLKGSGKDTVAAFMIEDHGFRRESFADPMKRCGAAALGVDAEWLDQFKNDPNVRIEIVNSDPTVNGFAPLHSLTVRQYWQYVGTEAHRLIPEFGEATWTNMMAEKIKQGKIAIPDARFENEQRSLKMAGGFIVEVVRPGTDVGDTHASEVVDHGMTDFWLGNDTDLKALRQATAYMVAHLRERRSVGVLGL